MSKRFNLMLAAFLALGAFASAMAQGPEPVVSARIVLDASKQSATVEGRWLSGPRRDLTFLPSAIGAPDLGSRIDSVTLTGSDKQPVTAKRFNSATYSGGSDHVGFSYRIDLRPTSDVRSAGHASWIAGDRAVIFADDVLPQIKGGIKAAEIILDVPENWVTDTAEPSLPGKRFIAGNIERAVFVTGLGMRSSGSSVNGLRVGLFGAWHFDDAAASQMAGQVYEEYRRLFGPSGSGAKAVFIVPFPQPGVRPDVWEAETRGSTVLIVSSDTPFRSQSPQRLHEQLRHEIFHLWFPNAAALSGRYDWFYEGFALYQSLRTGVALNRITFDNMLDTLSRARNIDSFQAERRPLTDASQARWAGAETEVYARGMLIAFACDIALLSGSGGRRSIEDFIARLFGEHKAPKPATNGNDAILKLMEADPHLAEIARDHVRGSKAPDWPAVLEAAGLENDPSTSRVRLRVKARLTGRQKAVLDKLGYNNWRRLTQK